MVGCSVFGCSTRSSKRSSRQKKMEEVGAISFHKFPSDPRLRQIWIDKLCRPDLVVTKNSTVCALHFEERYINRKFKKAKLVPSAIPTIFPDYNSNIEQFIHQRGHSKGRLSIKMATGVAIIGEKPRRSTPNKPRTSSSPAVSSRMAEGGRRTKLKRNFIPKRRPITKTTAKSADDSTTTAASAGPMPLTKQTKSSGGGGGGHHSKKSSPPHPRILQKSPETKRETGNDIQFNNGYPMRDYEEFERKYSAAICSPPPPAVVQGAAPVPVFVECAPHQPTSAEVPAPEAEHEEMYYEPMTCEVDPMPSDDTDCESYNNDGQQQQHQHHQHQTETFAAEVSERGDDDDDEDDELCTEINEVDADSPKVKMRRNLQKLQKKRRRNLTKITRLRNSLNKLTNDNLLIEDRIGMMINAMLYKCGL